jgi:hypothetical protein
VRIVELADLVGIPLVADQQRKALLIARLSQIHRGLHGRLLFGLLHKYRGLRRRRPGEQRQHRNANNQPPTPHARHGSTNCNDQA